MHQAELRRKIKIEKNIERKGETYEERTESEIAIFTIKVFIALV